MKLLRALFSRLMLLGSLVLTTQAHAYTVASFATEHVSANARTHVIVVGFSEKNGDNFIRAALTRARRYSAAFPGEQVVLIGAREYEATGHGAPSLAEFAKGGLVKLLAEIDRPLTGEELVWELENLTQIASLDFFGHSRIPSGAQLENPVEGTVYYLGAQTEGVERVAKSFTADAYSTLNGCNTGFDTAPDLSRAWKIPVQGTLTSTDFQSLREDGEWYFHNKGQFPKGMREARWNKISFDIPEYCSAGSCMRLSTENKPYQGKWGDFEAGLGFPKFFCAFADEGDSRCEKSMAKAAFALAGTRPLAWGHANRADFKEVVQDFLCPSPREPRARAACRRALNAAETDPNVSFSSFHGVALECGREGCDYRARRDEQGKVQLTAPASRAPKTQINEYRLYLKGFEALN